MDDGESDGDDDGGFEFGGDGGSGAADSLGRPDDPDDDSSAEDGADAPDPGGNGRPAGEGGDAGEGGEPDQGQSTDEGGGPDAPAAATDGSAPVADAVSSVGDAASLDVGPPIGESLRLDPKVQLLWIFRTTVFAGFLGGATLLARTRVAAVPDLAAPGVAGGVFLLGIVFAHLRYRLWRYEVRDDALYLERGVLTRVRTVVPLVRIQHTDTARGPLQRTIGLASTVVYTAGSRGADVTVPGLTRADAEDLQRLLKRLTVESSEDAV